MIVTIVVLHVLLATAFWALFERPFLGRKPAANHGVESFPKDVPI